MSYKIIRASEISDYIYCRRSWWLKRIQGHESANVAEMDTGTAFHDEHGQLVERAYKARIVAYGLIAVGGAVVLIWFLSGIS